MSNLCGALDFYNFLDFGEQFFCVHWRFIAEVMLFVKVFDDKIRAVSELNKAVAIPT